MELAFLEGVGEVSAVGGGTPGGGGHWCSK